MKTSLILSKANNTESPCFAVRSDASESGRSEPMNIPTRSKTEAVGFSRRKGAVRTNPVKTLICICC